ncbi:MAG TPA: hypothetical protein VH328_02360 [Burkholderiaceae bacterium]|jgi:hypothetical protein|nr:hypothetical protein [Burkholderiaceae bacterium]
MFSNLTARATTATLSGLLTLAMVCGVNGLAGQAWRNGSAAQAQPMQVAAMQMVTIIGHRPA